MIQVQVPGVGTLQFPDGTPESVVRAKVAELSTAHHSSPTTGLRTSPTAGLGSGIAAAGGLPGLNEPGDSEEDAPSKLTLARKAFAGGLGLPIAGGLETLRDLHRDHPIASAALSAIPGLGFGLAEATPEGFTQNVREDLDQTRLDYLTGELKKPFVNRDIALPLVADAAGYLVPVGLSAATGAVATEALGRVAPRLGAGLLAATGAVAGGATEGAVLGNVSAYGASPSERARATLLGGTIGALGGTLGGFQAARAAERVAAVRETPPLPSVDPPEVAPPRPAPPAVAEYLQGRNNVQETMSQVAGLMPEEEYRATLKRALDVHDAEMHLDLLAAARNTGDPTAAGLADLTQDAGFGFTAREELAGGRRQHAYSEIGGELKPEAGYELFPARTYLDPERPGRVQGGPVSPNPNRGPKGPPAPLPDMVGGDPSLVIDAWNEVSARYPRIAQQIGKIEVYKQPEGMFGTRYGALYRGGYPEGKGTLFVPEGTPLNANTLFHEFTHAAQDLRGIMDQGNHLDVPRFGEDPARVSRYRIELPAVNRSMAYAFEPPLSGEPLADSPALPPMAEPPAPRPRQEGLGSLRITRRSGELPSVIQERERQAFLAAQPLPVRPGEAGFILGSGRRASTPAHPMSQVIAEHPQQVPIMQRARQLWDRWVDEMSSQEEAIPRRLRRAGHADAADFVNLMQQRARGAGLMATGITNPFTGGTYVYDPQLQKSVRTGDGLSAVLGGVGKEVERDLNYFMAAQHHLELLGRRDSAVAAHAAAQAATPAGTPPPTPHPDAFLDIDARGTTIARDLITEMEGKYGRNQGGGINTLEPLADGVREWSVRAVLDPLLESGFISRAQYGAILNSNQKYTPFFRVLDAVNDSPQIVLGATKAKPIARISGGLNPDRPIAVPLESFVNQAAKITVWVEKQRVRNLVADFADAYPNTFGAEIKRVGPQNSTFVAYRNGRRLHYSAPADVAMAMKALTPQQMPILLQAANVFARTLRAGATLTLEFPFKNLFRDQSSAAVYGEKYRFRPIVDPLHGILAQIPGVGDALGGYYKEWAANGGGMSSIVSNDRSMAALQVRDITDPHVGRTIARGWQAEANPFVKYSGLYFALAPVEALSEALEKATRVGGYRRARLRGATPLEAAGYSRDITLDFARSGRFGQRWNSVEAFANAGFQDVARFTQAIKRRPAQTLLTAGAFVVLPAVANWAKWKDDPDYQALPEWERMSFYHVNKIKDKDGNFTGTFRRIPRPLGMLNLAFSWGTHAFLDHVAQIRPDAIQEILSGVADQTPLQYVTDGQSINLTDAIPTAFQPAIEATAGEGGHSRFTGRDIVPQGLVENNPPEERAFDSTTPLALNIGQALGVAPIKVDYLLRGYGGSLAATAAQGVSQLMTDPTQLPELPTTQRDMPIVKGFVSSPAWGFGSQPVTDFYSMASSVEEASASYKQALDRGDALAAARISRNHPEVVLADVIGSAKRDIGELRSLRKQIRSEAGFSPEQRQLRLLALDHQVTMMAASHMSAYELWLKGNRP